MSNPSLFLAMWHKHKQQPRLQHSDPALSWGTDCLSCSDMEDSRLPISLLYPSLLAFRGRHWAVFAKFLAEGLHSTIWNHARWKEQLKGWILTAKTFAFMIKQILKNCRNERTFQKSRLLQPGLFLFYDQNTLKRKLLKRYLKTNKTKNINETQGDKY
jgi:hypothetical protein